MCCLGVLLSAESVQYGVGFFSTLRLFSHTVWRNPGWLGNGAGWLRLRWRNESITESHFWKVWMRWWNGCDGGVAGDAYGGGVIWSTARAKPSEWILSCILLCQAIHKPQSLHNGIKAYLLISNHQKGLKRIALLRRIHNFTPSPGHEKAPLYHCPEHATSLRPWLNGSSPVREKGKSSGPTENPKEQKLDIRCVLTTCSHICL